MAHLADELASVEANARLASDEATSEETRSEGKYDTRAIEASYLARGQAERVAALRAGLSAARVLDTGPRDPDGPVRMGSLVGIAPEEGDPLILLVLPMGGGARIEVERVVVRVLTPASPLGRSLLGTEVGDAVEVERGDAERVYEILAVG